jgi:hypothetical protein
MKELESEREPLFLRVFGWVLKNFKNRQSTLIGGKICLNLKGGISR